MGKQSQKKRNKKNESFVIEGLRQIYRNIKHPEFEELYLKALAAKRTYGDDPIYPYYKTGMIGKAWYRYIWGKVDVDWAFWELVQGVEPLIKRKYRKNGCDYPFENAAELYLAAVNEREFKAGKKRNQALDNSENYQSPSGRLMEKCAREIASYIEDFEQRSTSASERKRFLKSLQNTFLKTEGEKLSVEFFKQDMPIFTLVLETALRTRDKTIKTRYKKWFLSHEEAINATATIYHSTQRLIIREGKVEGGACLKSA